MGDRGIEMIQAQGDENLSEGNLRGDREERRVDVDFPGGPVAETPDSQCRGPGFDPWSETWIPYTVTKNSRAVTKKIADPACCRQDKAQPNK